MFSIATTRVGGTWEASVRRRRSTHLVGPEAAVGRPHRPGHQARVDGRPAQLGEQDVRVLLGDQLVAGLAEHPQRDLVRHRRGRDVDGFFLAEERRRAALELVDGRILAPLLVADLGGGHGGAHAGGRLRRGIGAEVDHHAPFWGFELPAFRGLCAQVRMVLEPVLDDGALGGLDLVKAPDRPAVRRLLQELRLVLGLVDDREHRLDELVQRLLGLGLGRLDHQRLRDDQREVDRRRVEAVVHQPLRDVERGDAVLALEAAGREHELVHAEPLERQLVRALEAREHVVGVQDRDLGHLPQRRAVRADVGVRAHEHTERPGEAAHLADRLRPVEVEAESVVFLHDRGYGEERLEPVANGDRPRPGPAAPVRLRERLVQVEVDDVEAHVAGPRDPADRVQVRAVVVEERAGVVEDLRDLLDVLVEEPERRRIREHQAGGALVDHLAQMLDVDVPARVGLDLLELVAGHRHARRVRPVRGVGGDDGVSPRPDRRSTPASASGP